MIDYESIAANRSDLHVFKRGDVDDDSTTALFLEAVEGRAFNKKGLDDASTWPAAVYRAQSITAVQCVVRLCKEHRLKVCVRSGGHCWHASWLRGPRSVLLDVGDLNHVDCDRLERTLSVGPGATGAKVLHSLPDSLFFPTGHCPSVALGGFVLGGGFGIGFTRYSMTSMLVDSVQVVLGTGQILDAKENSGDELQQAVMDLLRGSHCAFPAVLTEIRFRNIPDRPRGVLSGSLVYHLDHYRSAVQMGLGIQFCGDYDATKVETTIIFRHQRVTVALMIWADTEEEARQLWSKYAEGCDRNTLLESPQDPLLVVPESVPSILGSASPEGHHYTVCAHSGTPEVHNWSTNEISDILEPIVDMWKDENCALPPASHTLFVPTHRDTRTTTHDGKELAYGFTPSLQIMTYAIYTDPSMEEWYSTLLETAHTRISNSPAFMIEIPEGNVRKYNVASRFHHDALQTASEKAKLLDPHGLFHGLT